MEFFEAVKVRRSVRAFRPAPIGPEKLEKILEVAHLAPSAGNLQAYEIYLATRDSHRQGLARAAWEQEFVAQAPCVLVFCANPGRSARRYRQRGARLYALQDATIACAFARMAATALGLASVWVGAFDAAEVRRIIGAPEAIVPLALLPIAYGAEEPETTSTRSLRDLVHEL